MTTVGRPRCLRAVALLALLLVAAQVVLSACGGDDDSEGSSGATEGESASGEGFPVSVEHKYGTTEIDEQPERVVTVGLSDHDAVLAVGVVPVAVTHWYDGPDGAYPSDAWPWAQEALGDGEMHVLNAGQEWSGEAAYNYEEIANQEPDLIIGLYIDMTEEQYDTLSEIAPTIAPSGDFPEYGMPWQETTRVVGQALGRTDEAEQAIADVEAQFAEATEAHPEFEGQEAIVAEFFDGAAFARSAADPRTRFMEALGFQLPERIAELAGDADGADISAEQLDLLDTDVLVWNTGFDPGIRDEIEASPLYPQLDVVREGRVVWADDPIVSAALTWSTVLSTSYAIDELAPQIAEAVAGNGG